MVIVGAGFGGLAAARALARAPADVIVIDRRNYHLFQPLLYQVATAALSPADIAWPIRAILGRQANVSVQMGKVVDVDAGSREVILEDRRVPFDYLVLATGARHSYFGMDEWELSAPGLKKIADATHIRERILLAFERAEICQDPDERRRLLTFVVVGGGPTGVELAGAVAELARHALAADFRLINPRDTRVVLVEGGQRVLATFPPDLSDEGAATAGAARGGGPPRRANGRLRRGWRHGGRRADRVPDRALGRRRDRVAGREMAGRGADRAGRIMVTPHLTVPMQPDIYAIGDTVAVAGEGGPFPGIAPAAKQMGAYVGKTIAARDRWRPAPGAVPLPPPGQPRHHRPQGGGGRLRLDQAQRLSGLGALGLAHVWFLIGWRNRFVVALNWMWSYVTFERGARLITAAAQESQPAAPQSQLAA